MTAWNAPEVTWSADKAISVARLQQISDSLYYLYNSRVAGLLRYTGGDKTTTAAPYVAVDATNVKATATIGSGRAKVFLGCCMAKTAGTVTGLASLSIDVDGTNYPMVEFHLFPIGQIYVAHFSVTITGLTAASHTFTPKWGTSLDTITMYGSTNRPITLEVWEV